MLALISLSGAQRGLGPKHEFQFRGGASGIDVEWPVFRGDGEIPK